MKARRYRGTTFNGASRDVHRIRAERALGKPLPVTAHVHHVDRDMKSLTPRLVICQDAAYHALLHIRTRAKEAGGNPNTEKFCGICNTVKPQTDFSPKANTLDGRHCECIQCSKERGRKAYLQRKALRPPLPPLRPRGWASPRGDAHPHAKISSEKAREIYKRALAGERYASIGADYGINPTGVYAIFAGKLWKEATQELRAAREEQP